MRLARRNPRRDQPSIGIGEIPPIPTLTPSNAGRAGWFHGRGSGFCDQGRPGADHRPDADARPRAGNCPRLGLATPGAASLLAQPHSDSPVCSGAWARIGGAV